MGEGLFMRLRGWKRVCSRDSGGGRGFVHETPGDGRGFVHETPGVEEGLFTRLRGWERVCS